MNNIYFMLQTPKVNHLQFNNSSINSNSSCNRKYSNNRKY